MYDREHLQLSVRQVCGVHTVLTDVLSVRQTKLTAECETSLWVVVKWNEC